MTLRQSAVLRRNETDFLAIDRRMPDICAAEKFYVFINWMWHYGNCIDGHACGRVNFYSAVFKGSLFGRTVWLTEQQLHRLQAASIDDATCTYEAH